MRFVSGSIMTSFLNALAILIFMAQLQELIGVSRQIYAMIAAGLVIIYLLLRLVSILPASMRDEEGLGHSARIRYDGQPFAECCP